MKELAENMFNDERLSYVIAIHLQANMKFEEGLPSQLENLIASTYKCKNPQCAIEG